jgi:UDPglucose 6-dehydrogenase
VGYDAAIVNSVEVVNQRQKRIIFHKVENHFESNLEGLTFALWGLAFKPNTDDMREAPSCTIMDLLFAAGAKVRAYDPAAHGEAQRLYGDHPHFHLCGTREQTLDGADGLVVITEWNEFRSPDFLDIKRRLNTPVIFDGRNLFDPGYLRQLGFAYYGIGRSGN